MKTLNMNSFALGPYYPSRSSLPRSTGRGSWGRAGRLLAIGLAIGGAVSLSPAQSLPAPVWTPATDLEMELRSSSGGGIAADDEGNVFVAGYYNEAGVSIGIIRRSEDQGKSWEDSGDVVAGAHYLRMASRGGQTVAAAVLGGDCLIRRTVDGGSNWDDLSFPSPRPNYSLQTIWDVDIDVNGNLYVVVSFQETVATQVVRKRGGTTTTYSTVNRYEVLRRGKTEVWNEGWQWIPSSEPITKIACAGSDLYCIDNNYWRVRKSNNGGLTWTPLNSYQFESDPYTNATDIAEDKYGTLYITGTGNRIVPLSKYSTAFYPHWIVRKGTPPAAVGAAWTWETDSLRYGAERADNQATSVTVDSKDQVHVVGKVGVDGLDRLACRWLTRQYSISPVTGIWGGQTTDEVDLGSANGYGAHGNRITADPFGNVYAKGGDYFGNGWIIRRKLAP